MTFDWRGWASRLGDIDRRWIYVVLAASLVLTILTGLRFPDRPTFLVQPIYDHIEALPAGRPILVSVDYSPSSAPEVEPMAFAVTRHALLTGHPLVYVSLWPEGNSLIERITAMISRDFPASVEGRDWAVLGFKSGGEMLVNSLREGFRSMYPQDHNGIFIDELPVLAGIDGVADFGLVMAFSAGVPGLREWILFAGDVTGVPVAGGCTGTGTPHFLAYFPQQVLGLMGGMKGAAEYEAALDQGHPEYEQPDMRGTDNMGPQAVAHSVIILFIVLGNLGMLASRRFGDGRGR